MCLGINDSCFGNSQVLFLKYFWHIIQPNKNGDLHGTISLIILVYDLNSHLDRLANIVDSLIFHWTAITEKEGTVSFVTDFWQLNQALKRKSFPIPNIQDILQKIGGCTYATASDLNMGYYDIRLDPRS
jgi:hypothetical protein